MRARDEYNDAVLLLIVALRGGLPDKCDFCGQPYNNERKPVAWWPRRV
jgi:hypothetical protein